MLLMWLVRKLYVSKILLNPARNGFFGETRFCSIHMGEGACEFISTVVRLINAHLIDIYMIMNCFFLMTKWFSESHSLVGTRNEKWKLSSHQGMPLHSSVLLSKSRSNWSKATSRWSEALPFTIPWYFADASIAFYS